MLTNECERDIQLELNRNYLKSFPARLKFCHIVSACDRSDSVGQSVNPCGYSATRETVHRKNGAYNVERSCIAVVENIKIVVENCKHYSFEE